MEMAPAHVCLHHRKIVWAQRFELRDRVARLVDITSVAMQSGEDYLGHIKQRHLALPRCGNGALVVFLQHRRHRWGMVPEGGMGRRLRSPAVLPLSIVATLDGFYAVLAATDLGLDGARASGLMLTAAGGGGAFAHLGLAPLAAVDWSLIVAEGPVLVAVVGLTVLGGLLNLTGVKHFTELPLDLDRDLRATGATNIAGAAFGGLVGYPALSTTFLGWRVGLRGVGAPLAAAAACASVGLFGTDLLSLLPIGIFAAIVGCLGLDLLVSSASAARL